MRSAVSASSSSPPRGTLRCVERCWPSALQARRSETLSASITCSTQARRRAGLETSSPRRLLQDQLVERQVRNRLAQALVLGLQLLHAPDLIRLQAPELLAPTIVRHLGHADRADRIGDALTL